VLFFGGHAELVFVLDGEATDLLPASRVWKGMNLPPHLLQALRIGGIVVLGLTGACTAGADVTADPATRSQAVTATGTVTESESESVTEAESESVTEAESESATAPTGTLGVGDPERFDPTKTAPLAPEKKPAVVIKRKPVVAPPTIIDPCMACGMG
jgi:hypothetical protein